MDDVPAEWRKAKQFAETLAAKVREADWQLDKLPKDATPPPWLAEYVEKLCAEGPTAETAMVIAITMTESLKNTQDERNRLARWNHLSAVLPRFTDFVKVMHDAKEKDQTGFYAMTEKVRSFVKAA